MLFCELDNNMQQIKSNNITKFSPMMFLASLGAGGIAVSFFAIINYTVKHGGGLIKFSQTHESVTGFMKIVYGILESGMAIFSALHIVLTVVFIKKLIAWLETDEFKNMIGDPLANSALLAPFVSIAMTMNVFLAAVRYFIPGMADNLQSLMLPGLVTWAVIWVSLLFVEIKLLKISFVNGFDINKIHFGWLMHPFALGMVTVTGSGIAALAQDKAIADIAAFMVLVTGSMGFFLFLVKLFALFKSHFGQDGLPDKKFLPSLLIVVPNITIYAITLFRFGHYLEKHQGAHLKAFFMVVMVTSFAFQTWYMLFGLALLRDYFKRHLTKEFHVSQWGLVCPFVAYSVLGAFVYATFFPNIVLFWMITVVAFIAVFLFLFLLKRQMKCVGDSNKNGISCS